MSSITLEMRFPKTNEDHRLQLVEINGSIFAILYAPLESNGPIRLDCKEWSLILLAPIQSKSDIVISGRNVICFGQIQSQEGVVSLDASYRLVTFCDFAKYGNTVHQVALEEHHQLDNEPGALLYNHRLFSDVVYNIHQDLFFEAEQMFITGLCTLSEKMKKTSDPLDLQKVLSIFGVPGNFGV